MIPVKGIQDVIMSMGGWLSKGRHWPLWQRKVHKNTATAESKVLEGAVADLWENGDREVLASYQRSWGYEKPEPKEFIYVVMAHLRGKRGKGAA